MADAFKNNCSYAQWAMWVVSHSHRLIKACAYSTEASDARAIQHRNQSPLQFDSRSVPPRSELARHVVGGKYLAAPRRAIA